MVESLLARLMVPPNAQSTRSDVAVAYLHHPCPGLSLLANPAQASTTLQAMIHPNNEKLPTLNTGGGQPVH
jgi:hypothetical protein